MDSKTIGDGRANKRVAILQSNYIPWKGYFDLIAYVDEFILFDDMQYTRRDWRNRNQIKTPTGAQWLTVPVQVKGKYFQKIIDTEIEPGDWAETHWKSLTQNYKKARYFEEITALLEPYYREQTHTKLSNLNRVLIDAVCRYLKTPTVISSSADFALLEGKTERLADLCRQVGGTEYVSGPSAKEYIDPTVFAQSGVQLTWFDYSGYSEYPQLWGPFVHNVSILDLLFNCGEQAGAYMKYVKR